jgi:hypothetical protein
LRGARFVPPDRGRGGPRTAGPHCEPEAMHLVHQPIQPLLLLLHNPVIRQHGGKTAGATLHQAVGVVRGQAAATAQARLLPALLPLRVQPGVGLVQLQLQIVVERVYVGHLFA